MGIKDLLTKIVYGTRDLEKLFCLIPIWMEVLILWILWLSSIGEHLNAILFLPKGLILILESKSGSDPVEQLILELYGFCVLIKDIYYWFIDCFFCVLIYNTYFKNERTYTYLRKTYWHLSFKSLRKYIYYSHR